MRRRSDREKMLNRLRPTELVVDVPEHVFLSDVDTLQGWLRCQAKQLRKPPHGGSVQIRFADRTFDSPLATASPRVHLSVISRRDTSSLRDARWLSETPERTP